MCLFFLFKFSVYIYFNNLRNINNKIKTYQTKTEYFSQQNNKKAISGPSKPVRTPTIRLNKKQADTSAHQNKTDTTTAAITVSKDEQQPSNRVAEVNTEIDPNLINIALIRNQEFDVNAPSTSILSLIDLNSYECSIVKDRTKHLDRLALIEANQLLLINVNNNILANCCRTCCNLIDSFTMNTSISQASNNLAIHLAKCFTYQDLKFLRFNIDFGLGIFTGLELMMLPHGEQIRLDIIERLL